MLALPYMLLNVSYSNVLRRLGTNLHPWRRGKLCNFFMFLFKLRLKHSMKIMPKSLQNQSKIDPKWGPAGSLERLGALPRGHLCSESIFDWFGGPVWEAFGPIWGPLLGYVIFLCWACLWPILWEPILGRIRAHFGGPFGTHSLIIWGPFGLGRWPYWPCWPYWLPST